jgi:SAM-dependent methyltransferase
MVDISSLSSQLGMESDGIWYASDSEELSYPSDGNEECFNIEDDSFWFTHRNNCISAAVGLFPPKDNGAIFDIGGGNGFVSKGLEDLGYQVALVEPGLAGARNGKKRGLKNVICATTSTAQFLPNSLPAIGLFDVIEHIEDDNSFLTSIHKSLSDDGYLYATVPSYPFLWSDEDISAGHYRRYSLTSISDVLKSAGFEIEFSSYIFRFLPVPVFLLRSLPHRLGISKRKNNNEAALRDHINQDSVTTKILNIFLEQEIRCLQNGKSMSFGGSCLIVARKSQG